MTSRWLRLSCADTIGRPWISSTCCAVGNGLILVMVSIPGTFAYTGHGPPLVKFLIEDHLQQTVTSTTLVYTTTPRPKRAKYDDNFEHLTQNVFRLSRSTLVGWPPNGPETTALHWDH